MTNRETRVEHIDLFRAMGIILMIMGHIKFGSHFDKWIHAFHMPMFFFVSGWFYKGAEGISAWERIRKKAKSLLFPYICFEILQWGILLLFVPEYRSSKILYYILFENTYKIPIEKGTFGISPIPGAMWFLTAIFFADVIYYVIDKFVGCNRKSHIIILILAVFGMLFPTVLPLRLPLALDAALAGLFFFHIARMIRGRKAESILEMKLWQSLLLAAAFSALIMACPEINMRTGSYGFYLPFWINALGVIAAGWSLSRYAELFLKRFAKWIFLWMKNIGRNSIVYLCLNQSVILVITTVLNLCGIHGVMAKIPVFFFAMIMLLGFEKLFCNTKLHVLLGK